MKRSVLILCAAVMMTGCTNLSEPMSPVQGLAQRQVLSEHPIDRTPAEGLPETPAAKTAAAVDRYLKDEVKQPSRQATDGEEEDQ